MPNVKAASAMRASYVTTTPNEVCRRLAVAR